jgi:hypothetical protein
MGGKEEGKEAYFRFDLLCPLDLLLIFLSPIGLTFMQTALPLKKRRRRRRRKGKKRGEGEKIHKMEHEVHCCSQAVEPR